MAQAARTTHQVARQVIAPEAILVEPTTGDVVFARNIYARRPIASTTKMMTALITLRNASLSDTFTATAYSAQPAESIIGLRAGERMKVADLVRGLLVASANDAAATLAVDVAGSRERFVRLMNHEAKALGLHHTHYANPVGLDAPGNYSSASDLVKLALVLRRSAFVRKVTNSGHITLRTGDHPRKLTNVNDLLNRVAFVNGVKTGHTQKAGYLLVGSGTQHGVTLVSAVIGDPSEAARDSDTLALLRFGLAQYHVVHPVTRGAVFAHAGLSDRSQTVALIAAATVKRIARRSETLTTTVVGAPATIAGPLAAGASVGTIEVRQRGTIVARVALVTEHAIAAATFRQRASYYLKHHRQVVALVVLLLVCSVYLVLWRRRAAARRRRAQEAGIA